MRAHMQLIPFQNLTDSSINSLQSPLFKAMLSQCVGLHSNKDTDDDDPINPYRNKNLFDGKNYQALLDRLNNGFTQGETAIELMKNFVSLREAEANRLAKYSKKSISKLNGLTSLSHYGTSANVLNHIYKNFEEQAIEIRNSRPAIRSAIYRYKQQLDCTYPRQLFPPTRKHRLADEIERQLINARKSLKQALTKLHESPIDNGNKLQKTKQDTDTVEEQRLAVMTIYNTEVIRIFKKCQQLERERLDALKTALLDFIEAIHPSHYANPLAQKFQELELHITDKLNSAQDANEWADILSITIPILSQTNQNNDATAVNNQEN